MSKSIKPITYTYEADGKIIKISRVHTGTAYARNGNVHNPTEYFTWDLVVDGVGHGRFDRRTDAYEYATGHAYTNDQGRVRNGRQGDVRFYWVVRDEMKDNYKGRENHADRT